MSEGKFAGSSQLVAMVLASAALVISVASAVVNYRQNHLANLESSLRDTKDQLQLAHNEMSDMKLKTIQQLVDAQVAISGRDKLTEENSQLKEELDSAHARIEMLEAQVRSLDDRLSRSGAAAANKLPVVGKKEAALPAAAPAVDKPAAVAGRAVDIDIYTSRVSSAVQKKVADGLKAKGYASKFPALPAGMGLTSATTVFYYDQGYKDEAESLVAVLGDIVGGRVILRKGTSSYPKNKLIVHLIGG
ncbi:hypothetical protein FEF65_03825 [Mariprofundus erugo]|uniref:LytR/CpsA/Psr regulator C-terminal domain-containing protein n=1 Tax=Mariprofundus erugo TaxID=2528639 RepID=A0A5R9GYY7_9PROT|nr:hypothetical protein [Mariprofundus erugo]TLS68134.1 hypothetical protein FEF65_03825 [Mariprofundus erugo]